MVKAISIGSLTLDLFFQDPSLTTEKGRFFLAIGGKYVSEYFDQGIGGGGANIAVGLSRLGLTTALWSEIGTGGVSRLIRERLDEEKIQPQMLEEREDFTNVSAILLSPQGEKTIVNHRSHETNLTFNTVRQQAIKESNLLYFGNMPELSLELRAQVLKYAQAHDSIVALNLGVKDCRLGLKKIKPLLEHLDIFMVNRFELADILHDHPKELILTEINLLKQLGLPLKAALVITDGEFGSYVQTHDSIIHEPAIKVKRVVDSTGAGDAFTSGFLAAIYYKRSLQECLKAGTLNANSVIQQINAQKGLLKKQKLFENS